MAGQGRQRWDLRVFVAWDREKEGRRDPLCLRRMRRKERSTMPEESAGQTDMVTMCRKGEKAAHEDCPTGSRAVKIEYGL